ncbi:uncharacterized protein LOC129786199 [Lutzomyia longipalpis]|uniref:uncharacterized protein LOC129786199 n=1 Tax=Lutzomyia longipalpis TaxID=7200 RepID=UPI002483F1A8|nr:uncharacterized protein LOC129786199 [Lutzomyia longipalpis]
MNVSLEDNKELREWRCAQRWEWLIEQMEEAVGYTLPYELVCLYKEHSYTYLDSIASMTDADMATIGLPIGMYHVARKITTYVNDNIDVLRKRIGKFSRIEKVGQKVSSPKSNTLAPEHEKMFLLANSTLTRKEEEILISKANHFIHTKMKRKDVVTKAEIAENYYKVSARVTCPMCNKAICIQAERSKRDCELLYKFFNLKRHLNKVCRATVITSTSDFLPAWESSAYEESQSNVQDEEELMEVDQDPSEHNSEEIGYNVQEKTTNQYGSSVSESSTYHRRPVRRRLFVELSDIMEDAI